MENRKELTMKEFSDLIYGKLVEIGQEISLKNPTQESQFPYRMVGTPIESVLKTDNAIPLLKQFQISITHWNDTQNGCMDMAEQTDKKVRQYNLIRINTNAIVLDETIQKYKLVTIYEVRWESLTNTFITIK